MLKECEESIIFADTAEFDNRTPIQNVLLDIVEMASERISKFYSTNESNSSNITAPEMLVIVTANLFSNLAHNNIFPFDVSTKMRAFNCLNEELYELNKKLFMTLETYYNTDEKFIN